MFRALLHRQVEPHTSDADLCHAASLGSQEAFSVLYRRYGALIYRFALRVSQDASIAEEVTQEVFLALLKNPDQFDPSLGKLTTWLCAIAQRLTWKHLERTGRFECINEVEEAQSSADDPHVALSRKEAVAAVRQGLDSLPEQLRQVIVLCEFEEMSYEEVAFILDVPIGTVRSRLHRAKARLAKVLAGVPATSWKEKYI